MPVLLPTLVLFGSLSSLIYLVSRRFQIIQRTVTLQKELEDDQKKLDRAKKKERRSREKALKELKRESDIKQQSLRNLGMTNELMRKVEQELELGQEEEALRTLIQVTALDEHHRKAHELLADLYLKLGQYKKAELICKKLMALYPFDPNYSAQLGQSYFNRRQFKAATKYLEKAMSMDKNNPQRYIQLGHLFSTRKDYSGALEYYTKAHRLNVRNIELMFLIVENCLHNSDPILAREYLHKILDYEPYNQQAKTLLGEVLRALKES